MVPTLASAAISLILNGLGARKSCRTQVNARAHTLCYDALEQRSVSSSGAPRHRQGAHQTEQPYRCICRRYASCCLRLAGEPEKPTPAPHASLAVQRQKQSRPCQCSGFAEAIHRSRRCASAPSESPLNEPRVRVSCCRRSVLPTFALSRSNSPRGWACEVCSKQCSF